jgi:hypothetical protein
VPAGSRHGAAITVTVRAVDIALRSATSTPTTQLTFVDRAPPFLASVATIERFNRPLARGLAGQYAVGDGMTLVVSASDDNALGWVVYELGPPASFRDSVALSGRSFIDRQLTITIRPEWVGAPVMSVYVRDGVGLVSRTLRSEPDSLRFYPLVQRPTIMLPLGSQAEIGDIAYDPRRDLVYIASPRENRVIVLSPSSMTLQPSIELGARPSGIDVTPSGDSLLVAIPSSKSVTVVDLTRQPAMQKAVAMPLLDTAGTVHPSVTPAPDGLRVAANGKAFVMLSHPTSSGDATVEIDLRTGAQRFRTDARGTWSFPGWPKTMGRTNDHGRIYLQSYCPRRYDSASDTFTPCMSEVRANYAGFTFDATGSRLTHGEHLLDADMRVLWTAEPIQGLVPYAAITPDGGTLHLGVRQGLTRMRVADRIMLERVPVPVTVERVFVAPSGAWALAFQSRDGARVARVDLR